MGIVPFPYKEKPYVPEHKINNDRPPEVEISTYPSLTTKKTVVLSGTLKDIPGVEPRLFVNKKEVAVRAEKWLTSVPLNDGENTILVCASNNLNCTTYTEVRIFCGVLPLGITVDPAPVVTYKDSITISGMVEDPNKELVSSRLLTEDGSGGAKADSSLEVKANGKALSVDENGVWSVAAGLKNGKNEFVITAQNERQIITKRSIVITKIENSPELVLNIPSDTFDSFNPQISGTLASESGRACSMTIEDTDVPVRNTRFNTRVKLKEGVNYVTFHLFMGSTTFEADKTFYFAKDAPKITITKTEHSTKKNIYKVVGTISDKNNSDFALVINGEKIPFKKGSPFNYNANIKDGYNEITITATNNAGLSTEHIVPVIYTCKAPDLEIDEYPASIAEKEVTLTGSVRDHDNSGSPVVIVNNGLAAMNGGAWSATVPLESGNNDIAVVAVSAGGKNVQKTVSVKCTLFTPRLRVLNCPRETDNPKLTLRGMIHSGDMENPYAVKVSVNDAPANYGDGTWTYDATLTQGANKFLVSSVNDCGVVVTEERLVVLK